MEFSDAANLLLMGYHGLLMCLLGDHSIFRNPRPLKQAGSKVYGLPHSAYDEKIACGVVQEIGAHSDLLVPSALIRTLGFRF